MKKRTIIFICTCAFVLLAVATALLFVFPARVTECDYTLETVSRDYIELLDGKSSEDCLKLRIYVTVVDPTVYKQRWRAFDVEPPTEYADRIVRGHEAPMPYSVDRLSKEEYVCQLIIDVSGLDDGEIARFVEGMTVRTVGTERILLGMRARDAQEISAVVGDKLRPKGERE